MTRNRVRRLWPLALLLPAVALPRAMREVELHGSDARIAPDGRSYALKVSPDALRVDRLPCGDVLAPPPVEFPAPIRDFGWHDRSLWVRLDRPLPKRLALPDVVRGTRIVVLAP